MTADELEVMHVTFLGEATWRIRIRDGGMRIQADVFDDTVQECVSDNFDYISETVAKELKERAESVWDAGDITDQQLQTFIEVLEKVRP